MSLYPLLFSSALAFLFTACMPVPEAPLSPELSQYSPAQENCQRVRGSVTSPAILDQACDDFLKRLQTVSAVDNKIAEYVRENDDAQRKPDYIQMQTTAHRQHLKARLQYQSLWDTLNRFTKEAIADDELESVKLTLIFPETVFTKEHYLYYRRYAPQFDRDPRYLAFEKEYAQKLIKEGLIFLSRGDKQGALATFKEAATLNNAEAAYLIGIVYEAKHIDKAIEWHTIAQENGVKSSRIHLARLYSRNHQPKESQKWYTAAAEDGDAYAQYLLYRYYKNSTSDKTLVLAGEWLKRSAENGFPPAEHAYALQLLEQNRKSDAEAWLQKAVAHGVGNASADLGVIYYKEKRYAEAYPLLDAADTVDATYDLGMMFEHGLGVERDFYRAYMLYKEAYRLGHKSAKKAMARVDGQKTEREQAYYEAAKRKEHAYQKSLIQRCGEKPTRQNIRTEAMKVRLRGLVSLPFSDAKGFLVHSDQGRTFYVTNTDPAADISAFRYVDISATATGNAVTVSNEEGATDEIYQFVLEGECRL